MKKVYGFALTAVFAAILTGTAMADVAGTGYIAAGIIIVPVIAAAIIIIALAFLIRTIINKRGKK